MSKKILETVSHYIRAGYYRSFIIINEIIINRQIVGLKKKYNIKTLGAGINFVSGAKVFLAKNREECFVIKGFDIFKLYKNEARILRKLNSDYFPKIIDERENYFLEEYFEGQSFDKYISCHKEDVLIIKNTISHIIECLDMLYKNNIVHRDIRPENIIISAKDNRIKLIDFGCSVITNENDFIFPKRIENYLGDSYNTKVGYWDDVESFINILKKYNLDNDTFECELESLRKRVGRIKYERK